MKNALLLSAPFYAGYGRASDEPTLLATGNTANDNTDLVPERWVNEALMILEENMVMPQLVNRNYDAQFQRFGDVVNISKPQEMTGRRKVDGEAIVKSAAVSNNIPIKLDQHLYEAFHVYDGELSLSFTDLVNKYIQPAALSIARLADKIVSAQFAQFMWVNNAGQLGSALDKAALLDLRNTQNKANAHVEGRRLVLTPDSETDLLNLDAFTEVDKIGTTAGVINAALGRKFGYDIYMGQQQPNVATGGTVTTTTTTTSADEAAGQTAISITSETGISAGEYVTIAGDDIPHLVTSTGVGTMTIYPALKRNTTSGAAVTVYDGDTVDQASTAVASGGDGTTAGYRKGWHNYIVLDGTPGVPEVGQLVTFGTDGDGTAANYVIIDVSSGQILLDRPLEAAVADGATANFGPTGSYNFGFHPNAMTFVTRPLQPATGGPVTATVGYNGLAMRITISYDSDYQRHLVTLDMLCGVSVLETGLGAVLFGD